MANEADQQSIRIEIEAESAPPESPLVTGESPARVSAVVVVAAVGVVTLLLLSLRPEGSAIAEDEDPESTTTASTVVASTETASSLTTIVSSSPFTPVVDVSELHSVIRGPVGFFALSWNERSDHAPNILRTLDGITWVTVDTVMGDSITPWDPANGGGRYYASLIRTDDGFAVLMNTYEFDPESGVGSSARIDRLISADGITWDTDDAFDPIIITGGSLQTFGHTSDSFVYLTSQDSFGKSPLQRLLSEQFVGVDTDEACNASLESERRLLISFCHPSPFLTLTSQDAVEPEQFEQLGECAYYLGESGRDGFFSIARRDSAAVPLGTGSFVNPPLTAADGTTVLIEFGQVPWRDPKPCEGFVDIPAETPTALLVWDPDTNADPVRVPISSDIDPIELLPTNVEPAISGRRLLWVANTVVRSLDIDTGDWTETVELDGSISRDAAGKFSQDGSLLIQLDGSRISVTDVDSGHRRFLESDAGPRRGFGEIQYADNETAFVRSGDSLLYIELPN